jgi:hypothetical protein
LLAQPSIAFGLDGSFIKGGYFMQHHFPQMMLGPHQGKRKVNGEPMC